MLLLGGEEKSPRADGRARAALAADVVGNRGCPPRPIDRGFPCVLIIGMGGIVIYVQGGLRINTFRWPSRHTDVRSGDLSAGSGGVFRWDEIRRTRASKVALRHSQCRIGDSCGSGRYREFKGEGGNWYAQHGADCRFASGSDGGGADCERQPGGAGAPD